MNLHRLSYALAATTALLATAFQPCVAQTAQGLNPQSDAPLAASASTAVPALVPFSGLITEPDGKPVSAEAAVTFLVFNGQTGGEPLFAETQAVNPDASGHYKVQLGATLANGLPSDLFATGEARWLEVQAAGQLPQPRVLLTSVPYALKAADSATLGGLPASAFVLAGSKAAAELTAGVPAATTTTSTVTTTGGISGYLPEFSGASSVVDSPLFVNGANIGIGTTTPAATLDVNGTALISGALTANGGATIGGSLELGPTGTATAAASDNSGMLKFYTSAYNSTSDAVVNPRFEWEAIATGNDTAAPSATLNLLSSTTRAGATNTGFSFNANGTVNFAPGQTFPGTGNGTIIAVTAGTGLTGGGATGNVTLNVDTTKVVTSVTPGTGLLGGGTGGNLALSVDHNQVPLLNAAHNAFSGNVTVGGILYAGSGNSTGGLVVPPGSVAVKDPFFATNLGVESYPLDLQAEITDPALGSPNYIQDFRWLVEPQSPGPGIITASLNLLFGGGGQTPTETGISLYPKGSVLFPQGGLVAPVIQTEAIETGSFSASAFSGTSLNLAQSTGVIVSPELTIQADDNGVARTAPLQLVIAGATTPSQQLLIGYKSDASTEETGGYGSIQATWENVANTPLMLQPNGGCVCIRTGNTVPYNSPLIVGQGQGLVVADGYSVYSSRRFKTDIQTLPNALAKVEKLRGVSYTLKATGKREIGVIAEEVGAVVPEVVTYEANGKDARSVDYNRLTALLVEATKEQQAEIASQQAEASRQRAELTKALHLIQTEQAQIHQQAATISSLKAQVHDGAESLRQVRQQLAPRVSHLQPTLAASR